MILPKRDWSLRFLLNTASIRHSRLPLGLRAVDLLGLLDRFVYASDFRSDTLRSIVLSSTLHNE